MEKPLDNRAYMLVKVYLENPELPKWKVYQIAFGCDEKTAKSHYHKLFKNPMVLEKIKRAQIIRDQSLTQSIFWDKNRLIYEYTELANRALMDGHKKFDRQGIQIDDDPDYSVAKGCYDSIGKIVGAFEVDNKQKKPETTVNLGDYFTKKELE